MLLAGSWSFLAVAYLPIFGGHNFRHFRYLHQIWPLSNGPLPISPQPLNRIALANGVVAIVRSCCTHVVVVAVPPSFSPLLLLPFAPRMQGQARGCVRCCVCSKLAFAMVGLINMSCRERRRERERERERSWPLAGNRRSSVVVVQLLLPLQS